MEVDYEGISNAAFMAFSTKATSDKAKQLVVEVLQLLQQSEQRTRKRKATDQDSFELGVELVVSDLLSTSANERSSWVYRSMFRNTFSGEPIGANTFNNITAQMQNNGLLEIYEGGNVTNPFYDPSAGSPKFNPGKARRFRPSEALLSLSASYDINGDNFYDHFTVSLPKKPIRLRAAKGNFRSRMDRGVVMRFEETEQTKALNGQVQSLNEYLIDHSLEGGNFNGYIRGFNEGNHPAFNWDRGGRLYAVGADSYQLLKKAERLKMKIDGKPVAEIDINASFLRIFHSLINQPLPDRDDPYTVDGLPRDVVKAWVTATFGHDKFHQSWPPNLNKRLRDDGIDTSKGMSMTKAQEKVVEAIPSFKLWNPQEHGWPRLMFLESEQMIASMEHLRDSHDIPAFSIHDSVVVPKESVEIATAVLRERFEGRFGLEYRFTAHFSNNQSVAI
ncbi:hypothetical protein OAS46_06270 [Alphaproteobacteria bacterium]|nr:hypothetical protein [Alphaproteobacteria bacterium]MDC1157785.1 hypothetical protein [Alphaproteobacteria bacterium]